MTPLRTIKPDQDIEQLKAQMNAARNKQVESAKEDIEYFKTMVELQELKARYQRARLMEIEASINIGQITATKTENNGTESKQDNKTGE